MNRAERRIPVSLITGFLGAGKTTLLSRLLKRADMRRTAVIINEMGEIGLDHELVETAQESVLSIEGGCFCCTTRGDLSRALRGLHLQRIRRQVPEFDRVVIETSGLADPVPVLQTLTTDPIVAQEFVLEGIVTVVDGVSGMATLDRYPESVKQVAVADRLLITKTDLAAGEAVDALEIRLRRINAAAQVMRLVANRALPAGLLDCGPWDARSKAPEVERWLNAEAVEHARHGHAGHDHHEHHHEDGIQSFCLRRQQPVSRLTVERFLAAIARERGADLLRLKGIVAISGDPSRPLVVHAAQHVVHEPTELDRWPSDDHDTRLVLIVRDMDPARVEALWDALDARATADAA
jgi:G3E family GTPase